MYDFDSNKTPRHEPGVKLRFKEYLQLLLSTIRHFQEFLFA